VKIIPQIRTDRVSELSSRPCGGEPFKRQFRSFCARTAGARRGLLPAGATTERRRDLVGRNLCEQYNGTNAAHRLAAASSLCPLSKPAAEENPQLYWRQRVRGHLRELSTVDGEILGTVCEFAATSCSLVLPLLHRRLHRGANPLGSGLVTRRSRDRRQLPRSRRHQFRDYSADLFRCS
jgi:hypothetical protein